MLDGMKRDRNADHGAQMGGPEAGGDHRRLAADFALGGDDPCEAPIIDRQSGDGTILDDLSAFHARAADEGHGEISRIDAAVAGDPNAAGKPGGRSDGQPLDHFARREHRDLDPARPAQSRKAPILRHALRAGKEFGYPIILDSPYSFCFPQGTPKPVVEFFFAAQKKAFDRYGQEIKVSLRKVEQWAEFRNMEDAQKRYREAEEIYSKVAKELGVAIK